MFDPNTLLKNVSSRFGAPMGRATIAENLTASVTLFRVRMVDGDYDVGGAYWGSGNGHSHIYAVVGEGFQHFVRASDIADAKVQILESYPDLKISTGNVNDDFFNAYLQAALWSSTDDDDSPLDANYQQEDIESDTLAKMYDDCEKFLQKASHLLLEENCRQPNMMEQAGHDFWLTRNHHGSGFWDGDWEDQAGEELTTIAHEFGEVCLSAFDGKVSC